MQEIERPSIARLLDALVESLAFPPCEQFRLPLRQIGFHREVRPGQVERCFIIHGEGLVWPGCTDRR